LKIFFNFFEHWYQHGIDLYGNCFWYKVIFLEWMNKGKLQICLTKKPTDKRRLFEKTLKRKREL